MPRLSNAAYIELHHRLRRLWVANDANYLEFSPTEQMAIHGFFAPAKDLDDDALIKHRTEIAAKQPSLPQRAGRAIRFLDQIERSAVYRQERAAELVRNPPGRKPKGQHLPQHRGSHNLSVRAVMRPDIDVHRIARLLIDMAKADLAKQMTDDEKSKRAKQDQDSSGGTS